jgi:hypothetical protein
MRSRAKRLFVVACVSAAQAHVLIIVRMYVRKHARTRDGV